MRRIERLLAVMLVAILLASNVIIEPGMAVAETANVPSLVISQFRITASNGQFVTLYNTTGNSLDMSGYQLEYFNNYDVAKSTSSRSISLTGTLPPHGYYMINDSSLLLCYQLTIQSESLGFSSTAGFIEVVSKKQTNVGGPVVPVVQDYVGWSKTAAAGAQTLPANTNASLQRLPLDNGNNPSVAGPGAGSWQTVQPDPSNPCRLVTASGSSLAVPSGLGLLLPPSEPPATIVSGGVGDDSGGGSAATGVLPAADIGLMSPQITELLPNPDGTGNDATDEFVELYNSNAQVFDLSGFKLQTGLSTLKTYTFPAGTMMPPNSFVAYYSEATDLSLSNTSSQAKLLDPMGNSISTSQVYSSAKDGQGWALAKGKWYWSTTLTPNKANVIKEPVTAKKAKAAATKAKPKTSAIKAVSKSKSTKATAASGFQEEPTTIPIHFKTLALIVGVALLYGIYEYRADLANRIYRLRSYLSFGRANRQPPQGRRSSGATQ